MTPRSSTRSSPPRTFAAVLLVGLLAVAAGVAWTQLREESSDDTWRTGILDVDGLDCAFWCSVRVSDAVDALDGAKATGVDVQAGRLEVQFDPARRSLEDVILAVELRGFPVLGSRVDGVDG